MKLGLVSGSLCLHTCLMNWLRIRPRPSGGIRMWWCVFHKGVFISATGNGRVLCRVETLFLQRSIFCILWDIVEWWVHVSAWDSANLICMYIEVFWYVATNRTLCIYVICACLCEHMLELDYEVDTNFFARKQEVRINLALNTRDITMIWPLALPGDKTWYYFFSLMVILSMKCWNAPY